MMFKSRLCLANFIAVLLSQWKLSYGIVHNLNASKGNITSANYPNEYQNNAYMFWKITAKPGQRIKLTIKDINFAEICTIHCNCDVVEVFDGFYNGEGPALVTFCSSVTNLPKIYKSTGNTMEVAFHTAYKQKAGRGIWFYYEAIWSSATTSWPTTKGMSVPLNTGDPFGATTSSKSPTIESTILVVIVSVTVVLSVMVIFCCGIKKRWSTRDRRRSATPRPQPSADQIFDTTEELTFDQMRNAPPSYEEAVTNSRQNISTPPLSYTGEPNNNIHTDPFASETPSQSNSRSTVEPYDPTGLPSYAEAHRLSQNSLDRV